MLIGFDGCLIVVHRSLLFPNIMMMMVMVMVMVMVILMHCLHQASSKQTNAAHPDGRE